MSARKPERHQGALLDRLEPGRGRPRRSTEESSGVTFYLTPHAKERMGERGIVDKDIQIVLEKPDALEPSIGRRSAARKYCGARTLEVVFGKDGKVAVIQTAYWLERAG